MTIEESKIKRIYKSRQNALTANERFHASGGVCPQTVLWEFGSL